MAEKLSLNELIRAAEKNGTPLSRLVIHRQAESMETSPAAIEEKLRVMLRVMRDSIDMGLQGGLSVSGMTGGDGRKMDQFRLARPEAQLLGTIGAKAISYALAVGEANAAMGRICAAPTAGSSGVLPGVFYALAEECSIEEEELIYALLTAGCIGEVIASRATLAGAEGGCQAECGSAAAMAAGAVTDLLGGTPDQVGQAVAISLKNLLGLVCDPVAGLVEVPCIKRNAGAALIALGAAQMALAGICSVIPVDEVIDAMGIVGKQLPACLRETAEGGLAVTPTGRELAAKICPA